MVKKGIISKRNNNKKQLLYRILIHNHGAEFLIHNTASKENSDHSKSCTEFSMVKKISIEGTVSQEGLIKNVLKSVAAMEVILGSTAGKNTFRSWISFVRCFASTTDIFIIYEERNISTTHSVLQLRGFGFNSRPEFYIKEKSTRLGYAEELEDETTKSDAVLSWEDVLRDGSEDLNDDKELPVSTLGCSFLQRTDVLNTHIERNMSVVEWAMSLPSRKFSITKQENLIDLNWNKIKISSEDEPTDAAKDENLSLVSEQKAEISSKPGWPLLRITTPVTLDSSTQPEDSADDQFCSPPSMQLPKEVEQFSYAELKRATNRFSSENLIGEGGCSNVYKGFLPNGKPVAVKVLKSYNEAWSDFSLEVDIISSLKHKHITSLIGVCIEENNLVLVYDFLPKGSLEESLHDNNSVLSWEVRFKVALAIAEALNYLHNEHSQPVIHRDVKSSNILLNSELQPQLSDFGLSIWGPVDSSYMMQDGVVGTFGYIAPEYFMRGMVSDKIDVYSFGVVLLELLSGRRAVGSENVKGEESLVKWAKPILESGNVEALLDPNLRDDFDIDEMQRMVLVANLCINISAESRPKASQILQLLRGEEDAREWINSHCSDDEFLLEISSEPPTIDTDSAAIIPVSSTEQKPKKRLKLRDLLKEQQD